MFDKSVYEKLVESGTVAAGTYAQNYEMYQRSNATVAGRWQFRGGFVSSIAALGAAVIGHDFRVTVSAGNNQYGMAGYFDSTLSGTTVGHCYGLGSWINTGGTAPVLAAGHIIVPIEGGVYTGEAQAAARVVFAGQHQAILNGAPASLHAWRLNATQTITALIAAANPGTVGYTAGTGTAGTQLGYIPMFDIVGVGIGYLRIYATAT